MGLFYDQGCSAKADISQYAVRMGGAKLPYSNKSVFIENECISCQAVVEDNGNNNHNNGEVQIEELCKQQILLEQVLKKMYNNNIKCCCISWYGSK